MSKGDIRLVCEGEPRSRDTRWLNLVLSELAESFELAGRVQVVPAGSKSDLAATVRGMRQAFETTDVYAIRDRDFLTAELLPKDVGKGVYPLQRHCLESYLLEPALLEAALGLGGVEVVEGKLVALAECRFWPDVGCAVVDAISYEMRKNRPHLGREILTSKEQVTQAVKSLLDVFHGEAVVKRPDVEVLIDAFERDMRSGPLWARVNGKELMKALGEELAASALPGGDIESNLFKWCKRNGPPRPFVADVRRILEGLPSTPRPSPFSSQ